LKIFSITLQNYRQYKSVKIEPSTDEKRNFTVIQGPNGAGKTNLMNALTWCLYGIEPHLSSDSTGFLRANMAAFSDLKIDDDLDVRVQISLGETKPEYIIDRKENYVKRGAKPENAIINQARTILFLDRYDWKTHAYPTSLLNRILPEDVSAFFFFDGERLDEFFKAESREKVRDALLDVSQVTLLDNALGRLDGLKDDLRRSAKGLSSQADVILEKLEACKKELGGSQTKLRGLETDKTETIRLISGIDEKLKNSPRENIQTLQNERQTLTQDGKGLQDETSEAMEDLNSAIVRFGPIIFAKPAVDLAINEVEKRYKTGELPPKIQEQYLNDLLKQGKCICGTDIASHGTPRENVERQLHASSFSEIEDQIREGKFELGEIHKRTGDFPKIADEIGVNIVKNSETLKRKGDRLKEISEILSKYDEEEIQRLESDRLRLQSQKEKLLEEIGLARGEVEGKKKEFASLENLHKNELRKSAKHAAVQSQVDLCQKAIASMDGIKTNIVDEIRKIIEAKTKQYFLSLIWKKGTFVDVKIDESYTLSVVHKGGWNALGTLSAGERQMLALSFMAALKEVSGFHFPVVIDTPLGRISREPKDNVAESLPKYLEGTQVTMLMTDEEYTESVRKRMSPRIGKELKLEYEESKDQTLVMKYAS